MTTLGGDAAITEGFVLSRRLRVEITAGPAGVACEWLPRVPSKLSGGELRRYRRARDHMMQRVAEVTGGPVLVVELPKQ